MSFLAALLFLYEPVKRITNLHNIFQQALGASEKVFAYLDQPEEIEDKPGARRLEKFRDRIVFDNVSFRYPAASGMQLERVSLEICAGEVVALVGSSGAGKTTLASLVPRFRDVVSGAVRIDGIDIRNLGLASLRDKISVVAQETFLFNDTVANNIAYGMEKVDRARLIEASQAALAHEFIEKLPQGYETVIGDRGRQAFRRTTAAPRHRPGNIEELADPDSRRSHVPSGYRVRDAGAEGVGESDDGPHRDCDRPSHFDHPAGG